MNLKKLVAKTLVFAMAMTFVPAVNMSTAKAAAPTVKFDGDAGVITSSADDCYWTVAKVVKDAKKADIVISGVNYKVSVIEPVIGKTIDATALGTSKESIVLVGSKAELDPAEWAVVKVPAQAKNFVVSYFASNAATDIKKVAVTPTLGNEYGYLAAVTLPAGGVAGNSYDLAGGAGKNVEVKNGNGKWKSVNDFFGGTDAAKFGAKLQMLAQKGASLTFRIAGVEGAWPSKEVKVKIPAQAKGPSVKVDVAKNEISLKAGMQYRVGLNGTAPAGNWKDVPAATKKMSLTDSNIGIDGTQDAVVEVRTVAKGKNIVSKVNTVSLKKQAAPTLVALVKDGDLIAGKLTLKVKVPYDITKGAELISKDTEHEYEVYVSKDGSAPTANAKWTKIKAAKAADKPSKGALKYSKADKPNTYTDDNTNTKIYVRYAGSVDKKTGVTTMAGATANETFKLAKIEQAVTMTPASGEITVVAKTAKEETVKFAITNIVKFGGSPKIKVTSPLAGVAIKAGKVTADSGTPTTGNIDLTVKVTDKAFPEAISGTKDLKFTLTYEGASKEVTLKFKN